MTCGGLFTFIVTTVYLMLLPSNGITTDVKKVVVEDE